MYFTPERDDEYIYYISYTREEPRSVGSPADKNGLVI